MFAERADSTRPMPTKTGIAFVNILPRLIATSAPMELIQFRRLRRLDPRRLGNAPRAPTPFGPRLIVSQGAAQPAVESAGEWLSVIIAFPATMVDRIRQPDPASAHLAVLA